MTAPAGLQIADWARIPAPTMDESPDTQYHGPWTFTWSGWRALPACDFLYGFWTAINIRTGRRIYSTSGGMIHAYRVGESFDVRYLDGRTPLTQDLPPPVLRAERQAALDRLRNGLGPP